MRKYYRVVDGQAVRVKGPVYVRQFKWNRPVSVVPCVAWWSKSSRPVLCAIPF